jgi:ankyrin repeat protein
MIELLLKNGANVNIRNTRTGIAPIHYLAKTGNASLMAFLFERAWYCIDPNMSDDGVERKLAIHLASKFGHAEIVQMLLTRTQSLHKDCVSGSGKTPLMYAAQYNHLPVIRVLAEHSADVNFTNTKNEGLTALHYAVMSGNKETVTELLNMDAHMCPSNISNGMSPVHYAAFIGHVNILNLLYEYGGSLELPVRDEGGNLPIHLAAMQGHEDIVRWIQERQRLSLFAWNKLGYTPLHLATINYRINVMKYIIDTAGIHVDMTTYDGFRHTALHLASSLGDDSVINCLIDREADVNKMSAENRYTPLHYATMKNFPKSIELLYQAGGNVHVRYGNEGGIAGGEPLLITAVKYKAYDAAGFLMSEKLGVYPDHKDKDGRTALHYAVEFGNVELTGSLVSKGANVNCQDKWKQTPLHYAVQKGDISLLKEILRVSPYLSVKDVYGMNAVHLAALHADVPSLQLLLKDKAYFYVHTSNAARDLPIHLAAYGGNINVVQWIVECGVRVDIPNGSGKTALDIAIERGNKELIHLLKNICVSEGGNE